MAGAKKAFTGAYDWLINALAVLAALSIALVFVLIVANVTVRALGFSPPSFTLAVVEYALLYMTMFAAPYLLRKKGHVLIDALTSRMPPRMAWASAKFAYLLSIACALVFVWFGSELLLHAIQSGRMDERGIDIPVWLLYLPIPIGFTFVATEFMRYLLGRDTLYTDRTTPRDSV